MKAQPDSYIRRTFDFFKCALWSEKYSTLICSQATICLARTQKPVSECYVIEWFMGTIVEWYKYCALLVQLEGCAS